MQIIARWLPRPRYLGVSLPRKAVGQLQHKAAAGISLQTAPGGDKPFVAVPAWRPPPRPPAWLALVVEPVPHSFAPCRIVVSGEQLSQAVMPHSVNIFDFQAAFQMTEEQVGTAQPTWHRWVPPGGSMQAHLGQHRAISLLHGGADMGTVWAMHPPKSDAACMCPLPSATRTPLNGAWKARGCSQHPSTCLLQALGVSDHFPVEFELKAKGGFFDWLKSKFSKKRRGRKNRQAKS